MGIAALFGGAFWLADGIYQYYFFHKNLKFLLLEGPESLLDSIVFNVPPRAIVVRISFIIACLMGGILVAVFLHRQRKAQKGLAESEENLRTLVESSTDSILTLDPDRRITDCNSSFLNQFDYSREEVIGQLVSIIHPSRESFDLYGQTVYPVIARKGFWKGEWELKRKDGSIFPVEIANSAMKRSDGSIHGYVAILRDITERKQAEDALKESEDRFRTLMEQSPIAIQVMAPDGRIVQVNDAYVRFRGVTLEDISEYNILQDEQAKRLGLMPYIKRAFAGEALSVPPFEYDPVKTVKKGRERWMQSFIYPLKGENGEIRNVIMMHEDITELKQAEKELAKHREHLEEVVRGRTVELDKRISEVEQLNSAMVNLLADLRVSKENLELTTRQLSDANKELESFSYSVSHDLRAPLRAIDGFSQILVEDYGDKLDENGQHQLDVIQGSARQMGQLIDDLLAFSRLGRKGMSMSEIDMGVLAQEVFEQLQLGTPGRAVKLKVDTLPSAYGDRAMIREVLVNFSSNAMKFTRPGKAPVIEVTGRVDGDENVYSVKDKGVGFDMKYVDKLFQVFQRLHSAEEYEGTGIGLALVQRIIRRHGGRVWAEGKVNKGATFYFSLPRS